jgi:hypothetical protein
MDPNYTWKDLIAKAYSMGVDLSTRYWLYNKAGPNNHTVYGAACSEATIDVLT